jgi:hypothetical protein
MPIAVGWNEYDDRELVVLVREYYPPLPPGDDGFWERDLVRELAQRLDSVLGAAEAAC